MNSQPPFSQDLPPVSPPAQPRPEAGALDSTILLAGRRAVDIVHNGNVYRLQATRLGKLILTK